MNERWPKCDQNVTIFQPDISTPLGDWQFVVRRDGSPLPAAFQASEAAVVKCHLERQTGEQKLI